MDVIKQIMIVPTHDERLKHEDYLRRVEEIKFEMAERYRLHPNNFITKKNGNDPFRDCNVPLHLCRNREALVNIDDLVWDEKRIDTIGSNGDGFPDRSHYGEL